MLAAGLLAVIGCRTASQTTSPKPTSQSVPRINHNVSYQDVRFTFDPSLAPEIKSETVSTSVEGKPCDLWPEHSAFTLVGYSQRTGLPENFPHVRVFPIAKFREAFSIASKENAKHVVYPPNPEDWTTYFDTEVRVLKALLGAKPTQPEVSRFLAKERGEAGCKGAMPFLPMWEACQAFVTRVRYTDFNGGRGVFFLTQWDRETSQISNESLDYAYQGITNDGKYWVYAEFPVTAPFLPKGDEPEVVAWNQKNYLLSHNSKEYQAYLRPVLAKLQALPADQFQPNLELLEQLIRSLEIQASSKKK